MLPLSKKYLAPLPMTVPWSGNAGSVLLSCENPPVYPTELTVQQIHFEILAVQTFITTH
jgi:hypothetical protein